LPIPNSSSDKGPGPDKSSEKDDKDKETHYCHSKVLDPNNSAYVDGFFSYLSSQLLHTHDFIHGIDFYGSYLAIQKDFIVNIFDDQEYLMKNDFFKDKNGVLFYYDESECEKFLEWNQERREKNGKQTKSMNSKIKILNTVEIVAEELQLQQGEEEEQEQDFNNDGREELALVDVSNSDIFNIDIDHDKEADKEEEEGVQKFMGIDPKDCYTGSINFTCMDERWVVDEDNLTNFGYHCVWGGPGYWAFVASFGLPLMLLAPLLGFIQMLLDYYKKQKTGTRGSAEPSNKRKQKLKKK
jgi:hypothetical protein